MDLFGLEDIASRQASIKSRQEEWDKQDRTIRRVGKAIVAFWIIGWLVLCAGVYLLSSEVNRKVEADGGIGTSIGKFIGDIREGAK